MNLPSNNNQAMSRKRTRPCRTNHMKLTKATLITSLLWLVALATTHSSLVKAFALTNDRTLCSNAAHNKQPQLLASTIAPLHASALTAELELDTATSKLSDAFTERPEDVLDLANLPLLLVPNAKNGGTAATNLAKIPDEEEVLEWAERYTSVEALRQHFGTNHNKVWGDLQASTARRLYKTLLPRALLELSKLGKVQPQDLAPLAYQARLAAKLYARERCTVPARIAATLFDGFRQWIKYGKFQAHGMTYDQLWEKYAEKILHETELEHALMHRSVGSLHDGHDDDEDDEECDPFHTDCDDLAEQVCRKILERACASNEGVDALMLKGEDWADDTELQPDQRALLEQIRSQLEQDMYQLLLPSSPAPKTNDDDDDKVEMPEFHGRTRTRSRIRDGKFRLVQGLARQRRMWKLQQARKKWASTKKAKTWTKPRSKPWNSRSRKFDRDCQSEAPSDQLNP